MKYLFRFEHPREHQGRMMDDIYAALEKKRSVLVNAPTGIGKTDAALGAALTYSFDKDMSVFFLTPKISQHGIVVKALAGISRKFGMRLNFVDLVGKQNLCVNNDVNRITGELFYRACAKAVKEGRCPFYKRAREDPLPKSVLESNGEGHNALFSECFDRGICAYEVGSRLAKGAKVIVADYAHMLNPYIRASFLKRIGHSLGNSIIIWDEAHNITGIAASYLNASISTRSVKRAQEEIRALGRDMDVSYLEYVMRKMSEEKLRGAREAFLKGGDLPEEIRKNIGDVTEALDRFALEHMEAGLSKRPAMLGVSNFLKRWEDADSTMTRIISKMENEVRISLSCLYPKDAIQMLQEPHSNIFMSATLMPLGMHSDLLGTPMAAAHSYGSPFPQANRIAFIDQEVTTRYDKRSTEEYKSIAKKIMRIKEAVPGNVAVFFPGFAVLNGVFRHMEGRVLVQRENMRTAMVEALMREFAECGDCTLLGVMGGSLSEGIDYANNTIKGIIVVGVPLERPSLELSAKIAYFDRRFGGRGEEYAYRIPAITRAIQAAGRAIRNESDRAVIVFMDSRYGWGSYGRLVKESMPVMNDKDYVARIAEFWKEKAPNIRPSA